MNKITESNKTVSSISRTKTVSEHNDVMAREQQYKRKQITIRGHLSDSDSTKMDSTDLPQ